MIDLLTRHPAIVTGVAFYLVSNFVDALKMCPPKPTDGRLFLFTYTFLMGLAGNLTTLTRNISK